MCREENIASVRALDSCLKEKLSTWLSPAVLELHQITWDDSASLLEKIVTYEVCFFNLYCTTHGSNCFLVWAVYILIVLFCPGSASNQQSFGS